METKKIDAEVLKARIEAMKASKSSLRKMVAARIERIMNRKNKEA